MKTLLLATLLLAPLWGEDPATHATNLLERHPDTMAVAGSDGWLFLANELRHVTKGVEWVAPDQPPTPSHADPIPALRAFQEGLERQGITLILVPVPAKAIVYAQHLPGRSAPFAADQPSGLRAFIHHLQGLGLNIIDLEKLYGETEEQVYCRTDSHWSPRGMAIAAQAVAAVISEQAWYAEAPKTPIERSPAMDLEIRGDLAGGGEVSETLPWHRVSRADGQAVLDENGPILLLGDSHTLVFSEGGDMHAQSGGFGELLAHALRLPVDRLANRGSASTPPRISLFRKAAAQPDWLAGKKVVVYCFTARELTESINGWRVVPVVR